MPANATPRAQQQQRALALAAAAQAARVLKYFEAQRTKDVRPRHAIAAARAWARGKIKCGAARAAAVAAHSAARAAKHPSAIAAARAAGHAAATAHMAGHAKITTAYAMKSARAAKMEAEKTNLSPLGKRI